MYLDKRPLQNYLKIKNTVKYFKRKLMEKIFEKPIITNGLAGRVVLFYDKFIIGDIEKEKVDLIIENIKKEQFNSLEFAVIIDVKFVQKYELVLGIDSSITFTVRAGSDDVKVKLDFQNVIVAEEAENSIEIQFKKIGFKREKIQLTSLEAAISPAKAAFGIAAIGGLLTIYAYSIKGDDLQQTRIKWYVLLFRKLADSIGYLPFLIVTILLVLISLFFVVKRMSNPPFKINVSR